MSLLSKWRNQKAVKRAAELETILEAIAAPMFTTDENLKITWVNDTALQTTGYRREDVVGRMTCAEFSKTPLCNTENCTIKTCMRTRQAVYGETVLETRDGKKVPIQAACAGLFDDQGRPYGGMEVIIDVSEAAELKTQADQQRQYLQAGIKDISQVMQNVADGDLISRVERDFEGELQQLKESINGTLGDLEDSFTQVATAADQVNSASGQISSGSQALAQGASEQASSLEEIASSLEEVGSTAKQSTANAQEARGMTDNAQTTVQKGMGNMNRLSEAIEKIKGSSDQTAKIVKTIDEIAFQTNLLALNAAVEAARAGEAGKGFAVVAEEVRNLAQRSAAAAKDTANLINESVENAENGVSLNQEMLGNLEEINNQVAKVNEVMREIAAASDQQSQGIEQITTGVEQMNQVTQQNAANAEESASAAEELSSQANEMQSLVGRFRLSQIQSAQAKRTPPAAAHKPAPIPVIGNGGTPHPEALIPFDSEDGKSLEEF